jgi:hypothetical protein
MTFLLINPATDANTIVFTHNVPADEQDNALAIISNAEHGCSVVGFACSDGNLYLRDTIPVSDSDVAQLVDALDDANNPEIASLNHNQGAEWTP